jgi:hypothetical protein
LKYELFFKGRLVLEFLYPLDLIIVGLKRSQTPYLL